MKDEYELSAEAETKENVKGIYNNGGKSIDRYTVVFNEKSVEGEGNVGLRLSDNPLSPQGISEWCNVTSEDKLGKGIEWEDLPEDVREQIIGHWMVDR
jgi:hypothetical protein